MGNRIVNRYSVLNFRDAKKNTKTPTIRDRPEDEYITYTEADRLDIIASRMYGKSELYWVILLANDYASELEIEFGEILRIPFPISSVLEELRSKTE